MREIDTQIQDKASQAISTHPHLATRRLRLETADGRVTLRGMVQSYFQKQMAQEALRRVDGVETIDNQLEVTWS